MWITRVGGHRRQPVLNMANFVWIHGENPELDSGFTMRLPKGGLLRGLGLLERNCKRFIQWSNKCHNKSHCSIFCCISPATKLNKVPKKKPSSSSFSSIFFATPSCELQKDIRVVITIFSIHFQLPACPPSINLPPAWVLLPPPPRCARASFLPQQLWTSHPGRPPWLCRRCFESARRNRSPSVNPPEGLKGEG